MPNWVYNSLAIEGAEERVEQLRQQLSAPYEHTYYDLSTDKYETYMVEQTISLWNIVKPTDLQAYMDNPEHNQSGEGHWYRWNLDNWGTKWNVSEVEEIDRVTGAISYRFTTPWSPPVEALKTLSKQYPDLDFSLIYEEETGFGGEISLKDGEANQVEQYDYYCRDCDTKYADVNEAKFTEEGLHECQKEEAYV